MTIISLPLLKRTMTLSLVLILIVFIVFAGWLKYQGIKSQSGKAPGLIDFKLTPCPATPNCVCSDYPDDSAHFIAPIKIDAEDRLAVIRDAILNLGGTLVDEQENYLSATFSSTLFGFVDDLEVRRDTVNQLLQIRSASRVGKGDLGVNRNRVELLRQQVASVNK